MDIKYCFPSAIITKVLKNIDNYDLEKYALEYRKHFTGVVKSNYGGWQSDKLSVQNDHIATLVDEIEKIMCGTKEEFGFTEHTNFFVNNIWLNINQFGTFNRPHIHTDCVFSGVYYVKCTEDSGNIVFIHPSKSQQYHVKNENIEKFDNILASSWSVIPKESKLVIFPAWLEHYVEPNRISEERISIAFNIDIG